MTQEWSVRTREAIHSMEKGDAARAILSTRELAATLWDRKRMEAQPDGLLKGFRDLLERRGYFAASEADFARSLQEIHALGEGFDLYDLARQLAAVDTICTQCLKSAPRPLFPGLQLFAPRCPCGLHPVDSR
jgi:hypothetical protein